MPGNLPKGNEISIHERVSCTNMFIKDKFIIANVWNQPKYPSIDVLYVYTMKYHSATKNE